MADHERDIPESDRPNPVPNPHEAEPIRDEHTRNAPDADIVRPDQQEELGPLEGLAHAAGVQATAEVTDSAEAEAEAERLGIEAEGFESAQIFSIMFATAVTLVLAVAGVIGLVAFVADGETRDRDAVVLYPELEDTRARAAAKLNDYSREGDLYRMPIEAAMTSVAESYGTRQAGDAVAAPANFNMLYLDANTADRMRPAERMEGDAVPPTQELDADAEEIVEEPEDR